MDLVKLAGRVFIRFSTLPQCISHLPLHTGPPLGAGGLGRSKEDVPESPPRSLNNAHRQPAAGSRGTDQNSMPDALSITEGETRVLDMGQGEQEDSGKAGKKGAE